MSGNGANERIRAYLAFVAESELEFATPEGGVDIATSADEIARIEASTKARYSGRGWPEKWGEVGIAYRDPYLTLLRDAVSFPGGRTAIHHRVIYGGDPSGAAVLPLHAEGIVLVRQFRHPTRKWHWEIPRGGIDPGRTPEQAARSELEEEIGAKATELVPLGPLYGSNSLISTPVMLFFARIDNFGAPSCDEGITAVASFAVAEVEAMIVSGTIEDSFTIGAFAHARLRRLI